MVTASPVKYLKKYFKTLIGQDGWSSDLKISRRVTVLQTKI